ncbi:hypothetical protein [Williamsia herbipolensis]|uniref:hypothetical protein n=1 Tax=Williamsia herbipolensis TaxID=1603258 RepID=UPI0005F79B37|nr:hypothetical protein [Williamsia herbipolensis]
MRKLAILVNCTQRKSVRATPHLSAGTLPQGTVAARAAEWISRVQGADSERSLIDLYNGEAWAQAKLLLNDALQAGFAAQLFVASAGLGLRSVNTKAPSYAATFSPNQLDSVATSLDDSKEWWGLMQETDETAAADNFRDSAVLAVMSESYARVLHDELRALSGSAGEMLIVGGARLDVGCPRVPADRALRTAMGGTVSSLNLRTARRWMSTRTSPSLFSDADYAKWQTWAHGVRQVETYDRQQLDDAQVRAFAMKLIHSSPGGSATQALRELRTSGFACEQKRFHRIYAQLVRETT